MTQFLLQIYAGLESESITDNPPTPLGQSLLDRNTPETPSLPQPSHNNYINPKYCSYSGPHCNLITNPNHKPGFLSGVVSEIYLNTQKASLYFRSILDQQKCKHGMMPEVK